MPPQASVDIATIDASSSVKVNDESTTTISGRIAKRTMQIILYIIEIMNLYYFEHNLNYMYDYVYIIYAFVKKLDEHPVNIYLSLHPGTNLCHVIQGHFTLCPSREEKLHFSGPNYDERRILWAKKYIRIIGL